jgi:methionyl-tRNA synthetase
MIKETQKKGKPNKVLVTTAIDYANDVIHIGHAYEKILADAVARYYRELIGKENVYFVTGTDEHGTTNQKAAEKANTPVEKYTHKISEEDKKQISTLNISYDRFIRTTDEDHERVAAEFFKKAAQTEDVYKGTYEGFYCEGCEAYKTHSELTEEGQCPYHPTREIQKVKEVNYFFKWSAYEDKLRNLIENNENFILPESKQNEMLAFLDQGLQDIPISRPEYKVPWGIDVPNDDSQTIYVWYDALVNYYTVGLQNNFWDENTKIIHFVGKDILRFHALLWPAMLMNLDLPLPDTIYTHGFINLKGQKISKSIGNVIRPTELVDKYGVDAVRYYFLKHGPIKEDVDISLDHLEEVYNADLANGLGNAVARVAKMAESSGFEFELPDFEGIWEDAWTEPLEEYRVDLALQRIWKKIAKLDKHINENEPWAEEDTNKLKEILTEEVNFVRYIGKVLKPFIPLTSRKIEEQFSGKKIKSGDPLFPRI